ncbi:MAG: hypothetical protein WCJ33_05900, partial [Pseudomonadota bacterium]
MAQISFQNSISTRDVVGPYLFEGEYVSIIDFAEINLLFQGSLLSPGDNVVITSYLSNDRFNILKSVATTITYPLDNKLIKLEPAANFLKVQLQLNGSIINLNLSTVLRIILTGSDFLTDAQLRNTAVSIAASNGDAITVTDGGLNVNLTIGDEITVSGEVSVSNFPNIQKICATNGDALTVTNGSLNVNLGAGEDVTVKGIEPQFQFYATPATNTSAVYADGAPGVNTSGGWLFLNNGAAGGAGKINWYVYANTVDQPQTAKQIKDIKDMYMIIYQKTPTVPNIKNPFLAFYSLSDAGTNRSWYKNRFVFSNYTESASVVGNKLLYIGTDNPLIHPEITLRIRLDLDPVNSTSTLLASADETLWLATVQTSSGTGAGEYNFVFSEYGINFTEEARLPTILPIIGDKVQVNGTVSVTGVSTETTLSAINLKTPSLGQQLAGASQPVVLTALQLATLTPLTSVAVTGAYQATQPVSGTFYQATQPISGSVSVSNLPATQPVSGTFFQATQPVSGSVSVSNLPATQPVSGTF